MKQIFLYEGGKCSKRQTEFFAMVDDADYEYLNQFKWSLQKGEHINYAIRFEYGTDRPCTIFMQRELLKITDKLVKVTIKDKCGLNCQRENLMIANRQQIASNKTRKKNYGYFGVRRKNESFNITIVCNGVRYYRGGFTTRRDAALAYNVLAVELNGGFAILNNIPAQT